MSETRDALARGLSALRMIAEQRTFSVAIRADEAAALLAAALPPTPDDATNDADERIVASVLGYSKGLHDDAEIERESAAVEPEAAEREDGARLDAVEALLWGADLYADGIAFTPYIVSATRERRISVGVVDGDMVQDGEADGMTLREAIDAARATQPDAGAATEGADG